MCFYTGLIFGKAKSITLLNKEGKTPTQNIVCQNGFEYKNYPIIKATSNTNWELQQAHWEFIPSWINSQVKLLEHRKKYNTLNAKAESILESKMYQTNAINKKCLIPFTHFFEWRHFTPSFSKKPIAYPYCISVKNDNENDVNFFAGIYNETVDTTTGELITSFAIITTIANELMQQIHNTKKRMPCILNAEQANNWLMANDDATIAAIAANQILSSQLQAHTIEKNFRASLNIEEFVYEELKVIG